MKRILPILVFVLFAFPSTVFAQTLSLTSVGNFDTGGASYAQIWYTNGNSYFNGTAAASAQVAVTIDDISTTATADASGNWTHSFSLESGDHSVTLTSGGETYSFTLTIGSMSADTTTTSTDSAETTELPDSGVTTPTALLLGAATFLLLAPFLFGKLALKTSS